MRKCIICKTKFVPRFNSMQKCCENPACVIEAARKQRSKQDKQEVKQMKERIKTASDWKRDLRIVFHKYIRLRDQDKPCISCGTKLIGKYDAGHFYSRGAFPNLAFDPFNVHAQCVRCNQHLSGNLIEYSINLPFRIGHVEFERLRARRNERASLSIPELKNLIIKYKHLIKNLNT